MASRLRMAKIAAGFLLLWTAVGQSEGDGEQEGTPFRPGRFTSAAVCGTCHRDIYEVWRNRSAHARAASGLDFLASLPKANRDERAACLMCHAPTAAAAAGSDLDFDLTREGVTCDFCHSVKGVDLSRKSPYLLDVGGPKRGPLRNPSGAPHGAAYSELHTSALLCAGCHEYRNPHGVPVLSTYSEWQAGPYAHRQVTCQGCHMEVYRAELVAGQDTDEVSRIFINLHEMPGGNSLSQLRRALDLDIVDVRTEGEKTAVYVAVTNTAAGHRVPGGLSNRRIRLEVTVSGGGRESRTYGRVLADAAGREILEVARLFTDATSVREDSRIAPGEVRKEQFVFPSARKGAVVEARLVYVAKPSRPGAREREVEVWRVRREVR